MTSEFTAETERIREEYSRRQREIGADFYALYRPANLFARHGQERALLTALQSVGAVPLGERKILDVGCGNGTGLLTTFELLGARRQNLAGIDLVPERVADCGQRFPQADIRLGNAADLPWADAEFDVVFQSTMFSSILDPALKQSIAREMLRVMKPDGHLLWYDFFVNNPRNARVRGVGRREIAALFPDCELHLRRVTLAPPLARRIVPWSWTLAAFLESLRLLNTHYFAMLRKKT